MSVWVEDVDGALGRPAWSVRAVFQPVVELGTEAVVGFEALARGQAGTRLESPVALFAAARANGRLGELELACQTAAVDAAEFAGWRGPQSLFLNLEPEVIDTTFRPSGLDVLQRARARGPLVVELTERALTTHPAELLHAVDRIRELGCLIALDDVGADDRSLALMPFLRPDLIKLDLRLIQARPSDEIATVIHAVMAEAERSGAAIVAEGIETDEHLETALAFGATLGQGYRFGRPGPLSVSSASRGLELLSSAGGAPEPASPFDLVAAAGTPIRRARKRLLVQLARQLEHQAASLGQQAVLLASFQESRFFDAAAKHRYRDVAAEAALVAVFGEGIPQEPAPGVRGQTLQPEERLRTMWDVAVVSPHFAAMLVSSDVGDVGVHDLDRRFDFAVVYDRPLAVAAARLLMARIRPVATEERAAPAPGARREQHAREAA